MAIRLGDTAPDFTAESTEGTIRFHEWIGNGWAVLFSHPKDFTPVCTTELGYMAKIKPEFDKRGVKVIGLSVDPMENHEGWLKDIEETQGMAPNYPIIADHEHRADRERVTRVGVDHAVQVGDLLVAVGDEREVERMALGVLDVVGPALVRIERIDRQADDLDVALVELGLERRDPA